MVTWEEEWKTEKRKNFFFFKGNEGKNGRVAKAAGFIGVMAVRLPRGLLMTSQSTVVSEADAVRAGS